jgi:hypothetical protein
MLEEVPATRIDHEPRRRWFADEYFDLVVWLSGSGSIAGFELCYDKPRRERAVTWSADRGYGHFRVDGGGDDPTRNRTPILVADASFPSEEVVARFIQSSAALDPVIRAFVLGKLQELS